MRDDPADSAGDFDYTFVDIRQLRRWQRKPVEVDAPLPPRFSLLALMAISTGAAVYCGLLKLLGVYGVILMLAALIVLRFARVATPLRPVKRVVGDMLAGIVLPIGCLAFDPAVFRSGSLSFAAQMFVYTLLGSEMLVLFVWLLVGGAFNNFGRSLTAGVLTLGSLICMALGTILGLAGLAVLLIGLEPIGVLGFVPWFTLAAFMPNAGRAGATRDGRIASVSGALLGILLPLGLAAIVAFGTSQLAPTAPAIPSADPHWLDSFVHH